MKKLTTGFILFSAILGFTSCYEDPKAGTAKIIVVDSYDFRVPSANVQLSQPGIGHGYINVSGLTDLNGEFLYTHQDFQVDHGLEVILDIDATYNTSVGQGIIRIKPGETTTQTVKIYP